MTDDIIGAIKTGVRSGDPADVYELGLIYRMTSQTTAQ